MVLGSSTGTNGSEIRPGKGCPSGRGNEPADHNPVAGEKFDEQLASQTRYCSGEWDDRSSLSPVAGGDENDAAERRGVGDGLSVDGGALEPAEERVDSLHVRSMGRWELVPDYDIAVPQNIGAGVRVVDIAA
eukprot:gene6913-biopygen5847